MSAADAATGVLASYEDKLNKIPTSSVLIQLALMGIVGTISLAAFSLLRPTNSVVYQPKAKYSEDGKRPPKLDKGLFSWVKPLISTKEDVLMRTIGLDAVCFLRFTRMCRDMFLAVAAIACAALLPINITYNLLNVDSTSRNNLSMLTIQAVRGNWLWGHVAVTYLVTGIVFYFVATNYEHMVRLRWEYFRSDEYQNSLHTRSLLVTQVKKPFQTDEGIAQLLTSLAIPYPTSAVHVGRRVGALPQLIEQHNQAVRALEGVLTTYFRNPDNVPTKRPTMSIGGFGGCGGRKVDAIDHLTQKIQRLEERIEVTRTQIGEKKAENYGFASFESVPYAHIVAQKLQGKRKKGAYFDLAPPPHDIIWENLTMPEGKRNRSKFFGGVILAVFCFFYTIPLIGVSLLANLAALTAYVPFIDAWSRNYSFLLSAFIGIVPPLLSVLLQLILPLVMRWIASYQGATTHSHSDRVVTARYSAFLFIFQFFIFSVLGVIVQIISKLVIEITGKKSIGVIYEYLKTIPDQLQSTWVIQSTYWLTVYPLRGSSALFDLAQVVSLITVWVRTRLFGRTPREIREWTKPPEFDYPVYFSNHLLMVAVGLVYAPLAPIVPLFAAVAFGISVAVYKYQLMYVCVSKVETGGRLWRVIINRLLASLLMMQALMLLTIGLQTTWYYSIAVAPSMISVIAYKIWLTRKFDQRFKWFIPSSDEIAETHLHQADARKHRLEKRFGHPAIHDALITPMLHKDVQHLLPTIYNGRVGETQGKIDGKDVAQNTINGLTFNMMEAHDLAFDRHAYLTGRHLDDDTMTVSTATPFETKHSKENGDEADYFNVRRQDYLNRGAQAQTTDGLPYELSRMPTNNTMGSQENLIQAYPPQYSSPPQQDRNYYGGYPQQQQRPQSTAGAMGMRQGGYDRQQSMTSFDNSMEQEYYQSPPRQSTPPRSSSRNDQARTMSPQSGGRTTPLQYSHEPQYASPPRQGTPGTYSRRQESFDFGNAFESTGQQQQQYQQPPQGGDQHRYGGGGGQEEGRSASQAGQYESVGQGHQEYEYRR